MARWERWRLVGVLLLAGVLATACSAPHVPLIPPFGSLLTRPVITPAQARLTFLRLESRRQVALHDGNRAALAKIDTGEALMFDTGELEVQSNGWDDDGEGIPFTSVRVIVPRLTTYPAWFVAVTRSTLERGLEVVDKASSRSPWRLQFVTVPAGTLPPVAIRDGYAVPRVIGRDLSTDLAAYYENGVLGQPTQFVLPGPETSKEVTEYQQEIASKEQVGWNFGYTFTEGDFHPNEGVELRGGAVLGFASYDQTFAVASTGAGCLAEAPRGPQGWTQIGPTGEYASLTVTGVVGALVIGSHRGEKVVGQDEADEQVQAQPCY